MNIRDLRYLVAVEETGNFNKAAELCHVSQPTLSVQIKKLEEFLDNRLIERNTRSVKLTEIGMELVFRARKILANIDDFVDVARSNNDPFQGSMKLGIIPSLAPYLLPTLVKNIKKAIPNLTLSFFEYKTSKLLEKLNQGEYDVLLLATNETNNLLCCKLLFHEDFVLLLPKGHPLENKNQVCFNDIKEHEVMLLEEGHCLRDQTLDICTLFGAKENLDLRASSLETLRYMVASGTGITFMPKLAIQGHFKIQPNDGMTTKSLQPPVPARGIYLVWRKGTSKIKVIEKLIEII